MVHFQTIVAGGMPYRTYAERGRSVTHVHDDMIVGDELSRTAARDAGLPWVRGGLVEHAGAAMPIMEAKHYPPGAAHNRLMAESPIRKRLWAFTMQGEDLPYAGNRVDLDPSVRDARGFPVARITYRPGRHELVAHEHFGPRLAEILKEMGAQWTAVTSSPGRGNAGFTPDSVPESRHNMGTVRMGTDPATSVSDPFGRLHAYDNVVVADSSVFVTSAGYGPTLTLATLAARAAHHLV
jgi:gluconate 2-dehydrogenase alpha chain